MRKTEPRRISQAKLKRIKQSARRIKTQESCSQSEANDRAAKLNDFSDWTELLKAVDVDSYLSAITPPPSLNFIESGVDGVVNGVIAEALMSERSTDIPSDAKITLFENRKFLAKHGVEYAIFEPTATGLNKSILDATQVVRTYFELTNFHHYDKQGQGTEHKVVKEAYLLSSESKAISRMSMYRPETKMGDPRMWFSNLNTFTSAGAQIAIIIYQGIPHLIDLTNCDLSTSLKIDDEIGQFLKLYLESNGAVAMELLGRLRKIACDPILSLRVGDTAVGMAVEKALGIAANSSKTPDYKGIEIKSGRAKSNNRTTLFAQVADWSRSPCGSSREILDRYGYERNGVDKLYCTVSSKKINTQGLSFKYLERDDDLWELHQDGLNVAVWSGATLRQRLKIKHAETFWIDVESKNINGVEHFNLKKVVHTRSPLLNQLMPLIESGVITMDHLIKRSAGAKPKVTEKGPLFKIDKRNLSLLFPDPIEYSLLKQEQ